MGRRFHGCCLPRLLRTGLCFGSTTSDFGTRNSACIVRVKFRRAAGPSSHVLGFMAPSCHEIDETQQSGDSGLHCKGF